MRVVKISQFLFTKLKFMNLLFLYIALSYLNPIMGIADPVEAKRAILPEPKVTQGFSNLIFTDYADSAYTKFYQNSLDLINWSSAKCANCSLFNFTDLHDNTKYFYRILIDSSGIPIMTSDTVWSYQDATPPKVKIDSLYKFQNTDSFHIPFEANDAVCDSLQLNVQSAILFYRSDNSEDWNHYDKLTYDTTIKEIQTEYTTLSSFPFKCPENLGDGYYEFYIKAKDWAAAPEDTAIGNGVGNEEDGYDLNSGAWMSLYVDTHSPFSKIDSVRLFSSKEDSYYVYFTAKDSVSLKRNYRSGLEKISLLISKDDPIGEYEEIAINSFPDSTYEITDSITFPTPIEAGYYYLITEIMDSAKNVTRSAPYELVIMEIDSPKGDEIVSDSVPLKIEWNPKINAKVTLYLYANDTLISTIVDDSLLEGSFEWQPQVNMSYTNCKIQLYAVISATGQQTECFSENYFDIDNNPPVFELEYPTGGEYIAEGGEYTIKWKDLSDNNFSIQELIKKVYLYIPEQDDMLIAQSDEDNFQTDTSYIWKVPQNIDSDSCKIRLEISDSVKNIGIDSSDWFSIRPYPQLLWIEPADTDRALKTFDDSLNYAMPGWTNQQNNLCKIKSGASSPIWFKYSIKFDDIIIGTKWDTITVNSGDSTKIKPLVLPANVNRTYQINCQLKNNTGVSNVDSSYINLDTSKPIIESVECAPLTKNNTITLNISASDTLQKAPDIVIGQPHRIKLSENPGLINTDATTKLNWYYTTEVDFTLSNGEGEKIIYCQVADSAGNWSESASCVTKLDTTPPRVEFNPSNNAFVHVDTEDIEIIKLEFTETVKPFQSWEQSIQLYNIYENTNVTTDSFFIVPADTEATDTVKIVSKRKFGPSMYKITVDQFKDLLDHNGTESESYFYVFVEKEIGGIVRRNIPERNNSEISVKIEMNELPVDAVVMLEMLQCPSTSSADWEKLSEFTPIENTCWSVNLLDNNHKIVDSQYTITSKLDLTNNSESIEAAFNSTKEEPYLAYKAFDSEYWEWMKNSTFNNGNYSLQMSINQRVSGEYCVLNVSENNVSDSYCYPNPYSSETTIRFYMTKEDNFSRVSIYDVFGNLVIKKPIPNPGEGMKEVTWDGKNGKGEPVANGGYICIIKRGDIVRIYKLK